MDHLYFAWQIVAFASCLVVCLLMMFFFCKFPRTRTHPGPVLLCICLSSCLSNFCQVALYTIHPADPPSHHSNHTHNGLPVADDPATLMRVASIELGGPGKDEVEPYAPFFFWACVFFSTATTMWYLMLALDLIFSLSNPFLPFNTDYLKHHVVAWPLAALWCLIFRYVFERSNRQPSHVLLAFMRLPSYIVLLYITAALVIAWRKSRRLEAHAHMTTRRMAKLILPYLAVFATVTMLSLMLYLMTSASLSDSDATTINALDELGSVLQTVIVFGLFCRDAGAFKQLKRMGTTSDEDNSKQPATSNYTRSATPNLTTSSGGSVPSGQLLNSSACSSSSSSAYLQSRLASNLRESHNRLENAHEKLDISIKLRMDIMKYTSMGIMHSTRQAINAQEAAAARSSTHTSSHHRAQEICFDDYTRVESMSIVIHGEIESVVLSFRDCAPKVFHHLRQHFQIDPMMYLQSFDLDKIMHEHGTEGKSGNLFYFTANRQFMVKSVPKEEFDTLRAILPHYHRYLLSNPQSLLCRYFGCHSISLPVGKRRMYFVVMQNLFNEGPVHQRFDLKGNRDRRQAINTNQAEDYLQLAKEQRMIKKLMMDIDFRKFSGGICVSAENAKFLQGQLCDDVVFLASRGIIDYSVLLGVRYLHNGSERLPSIITTQSAGIYSNDLEKVYYIGIVDMLQRYNWRWTLQRWLLEVLLCKDPHDVSAVPPDEYGTRLTDFIRSRLFDVQSLECELRIESEEDLLSFEEELEELSIEMGMHEDQQKAGAAAKNKPKNHRQQAPATGVLTMPSVADMVPYRISEGSSRPYEESSSSGLYSCVITPCSVRNSWLPETPQSDMDDSTNGGIAISTSEFSLQDQRHLSGCSTPPSCRTSENVIDVTNIPCDDDSNSSSSCSTCASVVTMEAPSQGKPSFFI